MPLLLDYPTYPSLKVAETGQKKYKLKHSNSESQGADAIDLECVVQSYAGVRKWN
jgi:hypothetical protein